MRLKNLISAAFLAIIPQLAYAIDLGNCPVGDLSCVGDLNVPINLIIGAAVAAFGGFLFLMFVYYSLKLLIDAGEDSANTDTKNAFVHAILGAVLVGTYAVITGAIGWKSGGVPIDAGTLRTGVIRPLADFTIGLANVAMQVNVVAQGFRLIWAQDEGQTTAAKKKFFVGCMGAVVVVLATVITDSFVDSTGGTIATEVAGISKFLATIFGLLAVVAIIIGGVMLAFSGQDSMKENGKNTIIVGIVSLVVVFSSYALIKLFTPL